MRPVTALWRLAPLLRERLATFELERRIALGLTAAAILLGTLTFLSIASSPPSGGGLEQVLRLLNLDLMVLLALGAVVGRRLWMVLRERRRGLAGSRLHARLVTLFGVLAATPGVVVAVFAAGFLSAGLEAWFSQRVATALDNSLRVARAYLEEHKATIRADALAMAADLGRELPYYLGDPVRLQRLVDAQAALRDLSEAVVFEAGGRVLARSGLAFTLEVDRLPLDALERADRGEVVVLTSELDDRVRALLRLEGLGGLYLVVGRFVDPQVLGFVTRTEEVVGEYETLRRERREIQIRFTLVFATVVLLIVLAAVWTGLQLADRLASPLVRLAGAAERLRQGDLAARVPEEGAVDEIGVLCRTFNRMAARIEQQQRELVEANRKLDARRRFIEAVLTGISTGVVGLDADRTVRLLNPHARALLAADGPDPVGRPLAEVMPEAEELFARLTRPGAVVEQQLTLLRAGRQHVLLVRLAAQSEGGRIGGYVLTFDDVTELILAQRQAAWAEVARRIAHEIKNPLTPIRLSAERLQRKYAERIGEGREAFERAIATIVHQVDAIGRMVAEFSAFARLPRPRMGRVELMELVAEAVELERARTSRITIDWQPPAEPLPLLADREQIIQALTNLLKNAVEATLEARPEGGRVVVRAWREGPCAVVAIDDEGPGLPPGERHRLFEPYVTTKRRGSGLGLAIVRRIVEEHGGRVELADRPEGGACARLMLPIRHSEA